jgi:hypothetical protein
MSKKYKWEHPSDWLRAKVLNPSPAEGDVGWTEQEIESAFLALASTLDSDQIQDVFQREMDADGYFIPLELELDDTELHTWLERDRAHVELRNKHTDDTILEFWEVSEAVEDGFLSAPRLVDREGHPKWHEEMFELAKERGMLSKEENKE